MSKLDGVSADALRRHLQEVEGVKATKRVMVALAYKDGVPVATLSGRYGIPSSTLYAWLDRFEERSVEAAAADESRPGRPTKLAAEQRREVESTLANPPAASGYEGADWTSELVREHVEAEYGVTYSLGHIRAEFGQFVEESS